MPPNQTTRLSQTKWAICYTKPSKSMTYGLKTHHAPHSSHKKNASSHKKIVFQACECNDILEVLPDGMTLRDVMALGTAGYTAAIAIQRMEDNGQIPERGPIVVTGATGGVGSFAINMLSNIGYKVIAFTGKSEQENYLKELGASELISRHDI